MNRIQSFAAVALIALTVSPQAFGQSTPAAQAARLQRLQAQQAAILARAKAAQANALPTVAPAPTTAPTPVAVVRPVPTVVAPAVTAAPTATATTAAPKASAATSAAPATSGSAAPVASSAPHADTSAIALDIDALRKTRADRRHVEFSDLQARWGGLLSDPRAAAELKLHGQRIAYLQRIRALGGKDATFVKSVDALITTEETRDATAMNALRSGALPTTAPAAAAPAAAAPAAAAPAAGATK